MPTRLDQVPRYRKFVNDLAKIQEQILWNTQTDVSRLAADAFDRVRAICAHRYSLIPSDDFFGAQASRHLGALDTQIETVFKELSVHVLARIFRMRKASYVLTHAGEVEALARTLKPKGEQAPQIRISQEEITKQLTSETLTGHRLDHRITLSLSRIRRKVMDAVELSRINGDDTKAMLDRLEYCFPDKIAYKRPPRIIKQLKEADAKKEKAQPVAVSFLTPEEWEDVVDQYKDTELPETRFDKEPVSVGEGGEREMYSWEIEQEITNDFVRAVRDGESSAAKKFADQYGVTDFVWVAILDDRTDECCEWRNGLSTSEIRDELDGDHSDDDCQAETPPAHFNCRCRLAAVAELPERVEDEVGDVNDWLERMSEQ
jgi:hypothetical protein